MLELEMNELTQEEIKIIEEHRKNKPTKLKEINKIERLEKPLVPKLDLKEIMNTPMNIKNEKEEVKEIILKPIINDYKEILNLYEVLEEDYYNKQIKLTELKKQNLEITDKIRTAEIELLRIFKKMKELE